MFLTFQTIFFFFLYYFPFTPSPLIQRGPLLTQWEVHGSSLEHDSTHSVPEFAQNCLHTHLCQYAIPVKHRNSVLQLILAKSQTKLTSQHLNFSTCSFKLRIDSPRTFTVHITFGLRSLYIIIDLISHSAVGHMPYAVWSGKLPRILNENTERVNMDMVFKYMHLPL